MTLQFINPGDLPTPSTYTHVVAGMALFENHKPADTVVGVETLARPEYLIEVDAIAVSDS